MKKILEWSNLRLDNFIFLLRAVFKSKINWRSPSQSKILLFDTIGESAIKSFFKSHSYTTLDVRMNFFHMPQIISATLQSIFYKKSFMEAYYSSMILKINPKIVVTFADNNKMFYTISKKFPNLKTVMIQNGTRAISGDVFANLESNPNYFVDFICVHNEKIGRVLSKFLGGQTLVIGSLLNNSVPLSSHISPNVIGLISMYRAETQLPIKININGFKVSWKDRNLAEASLVSSLDKWCYRNNKILKVIGRAQSQDEIKNELMFYSELILNAKFEYVPKTDNLSSYTAADKAQIVVSMGSTLGYEVLGRGKKVAIFNPLSKVYKDSSYRFGWPSSFSRTGPFWTDDMNPKQVWQILDYVDGISMAEWSELTCEIRNEIMMYDSDNKLLKSLFNDLLNLN